MEMSSAYMATTAEHLKSQGWSLADEHNCMTLGGGVLGSDGQAAQSIIHGYRLRAERSAELLLETVESPTPDGGRLVRFYLEIVDYFGLRSSSYELDSWKFFPDRVEFKYKCDSETSLGPSFTISLRPI